MRPSPLPEISETAAVGTTQAIYGELRRALGVPMVNLVFRHMATVPGCLEWAWRHLETTYTSIDIHTEARQLLGDSDLPPRPTIPVTDTIRATLDAYIRANPVNLLGLMLLRVSVTDRKGAFVPRPAIDRSPAAIPEILPMADLAALPQVDLARLRRMAHRLHGADGPVIPSLFRHFTPWPEVLDLFERVLGELSSDGKLDRMSGRMIGTAQGVARRLFGVPLTDQPPTPEVRECLLDLAEIFPANMAKMTIVARGVDALISRGEFRRPPP